MLCKSLLIVPNSTVKTVATGDYAFYVEGKNPAINLYLVTDIHLMVAHSFLVY